jgi:WD40 repeat protein
MASGSIEPGATASKKLILTPVMSLEGHELSTRKPPWNTFHNICISYFPDGKQMISGSEDQTVRRWDLQAGKEIEGARGVCEQGVHAVVISRDGRWIVTAGGDDNECGELKVWEVETGTMKTFEGHPQSITCIDISADSTLLASGVSYPIVRIWNLDTGKLLFEIPASYTGVGAVRFSHDSKKLAVISNVARCLDVWNIETHRLDIRLVWKSTRGVVTYAPVFWTAKDKTIVAAFNFKDQDHTSGPEWSQSYDEPKTIYEFDASTLQTISAPFEGHTNIIRGLALSFDGALLTSASSDRTIKLWAFESRQLLASFDVHAPDHLIFSPNSHQLAYTTWDETKIYICDTPPHILATIQSTQEAHPDVCIHAYVYICSWADILLQQSTAKNLRLLDVCDFYSSTPSIKSL